MVYENLSNQNVTNINNLFNYANEITNGWFGTAIILMTFFISFISLQARGFDAKRSFATSSFFATIIAIILRILSLVSDKIMFISILVTAAGVIYLVFDG